MFNSDLFISLDLSQHNHLQIGRIGEYLTKMVLSLYGFDLYTSEVDDKGIDFIVRLDKERHIDVQVKTIRLDRTNYVFMSKEGEWKVLRENLYLALVLIESGEPPELFLIPSTAWKNPTNLLKEYNYGKEGQKSKAEWGINLSKRNMGSLDEYRVDKQIERLMAY